MSDPVRDAILAASGIDDPASAADLPLPRLRFALADAPGEAGLDAAFERARALSQALTGPVRARIVFWGEDDPPMTAWFPDRPVAMDERATREGAARRVATVEVQADDPGIQAAIAASFFGDPACDLWLLDARGVLLRPYDDRGADLVAPSVADLAPLAGRFHRWLLDPTAADAPAIVCAILACDVPWEAMAPTDAPDVRRCGGCARDVHLVRTPRDLAGHAAAGDCVALPADATFSDGPTSRHGVGHGMPPAPFPTPPPPLLAGAPLVPSDRYEGPPIPDPAPRGLWARVLRAVRGR